MKQEAVIVSAVRTAVGAMGGTIKDYENTDLAALVINDALKRAGLNAAEVDEIILGEAKQSADSPNTARVAALKAYLPVEIPAYTVHRQCASGLQAINNAVQAILCGEAAAVVAGGVESMSNAPYYMRKARFGYRAGNGELLDSNTESQPRSQPEKDYGRLTMGFTAENLAIKYNISREEQDEFAHKSQLKAVEAIREGRFREEILPVEIPQRKKESIIFNTDEHPRLSSLEMLAQLKPVFKTDGTVTAGNSSGRNDGAAALVLMEDRWARDGGFKPLVRVVGQSVAGVSPEIMGIGPVPAVRRVLQKTGLTLDDIGLIELNEAFAAQSLACIKELGLDPEKVNVNGGAIALGHPLGCSGARIMTTLIYEMKRRGVKYGLATLCIGGGMGIATVVENI